VRERRALDQYDDRSAPTLDGEGTDSGEGRLPGELRDDLFNGSLADVMQSSASAATDRSPQGVTESLAGLRGSHRSEMGKRVRRDEEYLLVPGTHVPSTEVELNGVRRVERGGHHDRTSL